MCQQKQEPNLEIFTAQYPVLIVVTYKQNYINICCNDQQKNIVSFILQISDQAKAIFLAVSDCCE